MEWMDWWSKADWIVRGIFVLLLFLSMVSWTIMLAKAWQMGSSFRKENKLAKVSLAELGSSLGGGLSVDAWNRVLQQAGGKTPNTRALAENLVAQNLKEGAVVLGNGLTVLASIGNSAPFIGLLGTVWGIMHALQTLNGAEMLSMDMVAGPVAEALVATAVGLFTAIPAVVGYNMLVRRQRRIVVLAEGNARRFLEASLSS